MTSEIENDGRRPPHACSGRKGRRIRGIAIVSGLRKRGIGFTSIAKLLGVSRNTIYNYLPELKGGRLVLAKSTHTAAVAGPPAGQGGQQVEASSARAAAPEPAPGRRPRRAESSASDAPAAGQGGRTAGLWAGREILSTMFQSQRRRQAIAGVETHVRGFFAGHAVTVDDFDLGFGRRAAVPGLRILTVSPGPRADSWAYVTAGCWSTAESNGHGLEFVLTAPARDDRFADLLAMTAYYHASHRLDLGHSLPIGEPWLAGSPCDHLLVSLPYLHGPGLEQCPLPDGHARILWVLPVTAAEMAYRREHGHEALEQLFDEQAFVPTDPLRPSVA